MLGTLAATILVVAVTAAVLYPLVRPPLEPVGDPPGPAARLAALEDRKAAIYGSIRDLGQDLRTDKLTEADYRRESEVLKQQAVQVLAEIEQLAREVPRGDAEVEARIARTRERLAVAADAPAEDGLFCTACGHRAGHDDRFCSACGLALRGRE